MAGILEAWKNPETGQWLKTAAVVTRDASKAMEHIHDRMPVLVERDDWSTWLKGSPDTASALFMKEHEISSYRVSLAVNSSRNNGRELIEEVA
jgi:putative SOS response-associated peptidase YedK